MSSYTYFSRNPVYRRRYKYLREGLARALKLFASGSPIMIFDSEDREGEIDLVFYAGSISPEKIRMLRTMAGGLICYATSNSVRKVLGLPFMNELLERYNGLAELARKRLGYGDPPAFTIWVNHMSVKTGIRDVDRAVTVRNLHRVTELALKGGDARSVFYSEFMAPGHVPLLASRGLKRRRGHTEMATALARLAGLLPSVVFAEMLSGDGVLSVEEARRISSERKIPLLFGGDIIETAMEAGIVD